MTSEKKVEGRGMRVLMEGAETEMQDSWQTGMVALVCSAQPHCTSAGQMGQFPPLCPSPVNTHTHLQMFSRTHICFLQIYKQNKFYSIVTCNYS